MPPHIRDILTFIQITYLLLRKRLPIIVVVCKETSQSSTDLIHRETGFMLCYFKKSTLTYHYRHVYT